MDAMSFLIGTRIRTISADCIQTLPLQLTVSSKLFLPPFTLSSAVKHRQKMQSINSRSETTLGWL